MELKDLIKSQDEELRYKANTSSSLGGFDLGVFDDVAHQNLRSFIAKVRKETAEAVADRMIGKEVEKYYQDREDCEMKLQILKELL